MGVVKLPTPTEINNAMGYSFQCPKCHYPFALTNFHKEKLNILLLLCFQGAQRSMAEITEFCGTHDQYSN